MCILNVCISNPYIYLLCCESSHVNYWNYLKWINFIFLFSITNFSNQYVMMIKYHNKFQPHNAYIMYQKFGVVLTVGLIDLLTTNFFNQYAMIKYHNKFQLHNVS